MALESYVAAVLLDLPGSIVRVGIVVEVSLLAKRTVVVREELAVVGAKGHCRKSTVRLSIARVNKEKGDRLPAVGKSTIPQPGRVGCGAMMNWQCVGPWWLGLWWPRTCSS
jgi:hypothetical protein